MSEIPVLVIDTAHSRYVIDQSKQEYVRTRVHGDASDLTAFGVRDGEPVSYQEILSTLEVGNRVVITHGDGSWIHSTPIQSVTETPAAEFYARAV